VPLAPAIPRTLRLREFLTRNAHPYTSIDVERDSDVQELLDRFQIDAEDVPSNLPRQQVLRNPSNQELADCLGFNEAIDRTQIRDLVVVGAGRRAGGCRVRASEG